MTTNVSTSSLVMVLPSKLISSYLLDEKVDASFSKALQKARLAKKMNQKQLAQMINEKPQVVNEYETTKTIIIMFQN